MSVSTAIWRAFAHVEQRWEKAVYSDVLLISCEVWVGGEQLVVLTKDMWKKELTQKDPRNVITAMVRLL